MSNILDPMLTDPAMQARWRAMRTGATGQTVEPVVELTREELFANLAEAEREGTIGQEYASKSEREQAELEQRTSQAGRAAEAERQRQKQAAEDAACDAMWFAWQTSPACVAWRNARARASTSLLPSTREWAEKELPKLRLAAKDAMIQSVPASLGIPFERLWREAEMFCLNCEQPITGDGSNRLPREGASLQGMITSASTPLAAWCYNDPSARQAAALEQQRHEMRQQNMLQSAGFPVGLSVSSQHPGR